MNGKTERGGQELEGRLLQNDTRLPPEHRRGQILKRAAML